MPSSSISPNEEPKRGFKFFETNFKIADATLVATDAQESSALYDWHRNASIYHINGKSLAEIVREKYKPQSLSNEEIASKLEKNGHALIKE